jgi:hypothetical protein
MASSLSGGGYKAYRVQDIVGVYHHGNRRSRITVAGTVNLLPIDMSDRQEDA